MTLSVFNAEVNGPNTLSSLENSFLNLVSLGKSPLVILINGKLLSSFKRILYLGENFLISKASIIMHFFQTLLAQNQYLLFVKPFFEVFLEVSVDYRN